MNQQIEELCGKFNDRQKDIDENPTIYWRKTESNVFGENFMRKMKEKTNRYGLRNNTIKVEKKSTIHTSALN